MKLSKQSWHFKLNSNRKWTFDVISDKMYYIRKYGDSMSLCPYFWLTVLSCLYATVTSIMIVVGVTLLCLAVVAAVWMFLITPWAVFIDMNFIYFTGHPFFDIEVKEGELVFHMFMLAAQAFLLIFGCYKAGMKFWPVYLEWLPALCKRLTTSKPKPAVVTEPSLLVAFLKAKKSKVCPLIEFEE